MKSYYALDFINSEECELVYNDQLYNSREEAAAARTATGRPELFDITEYTIDELEKVYMSEIYIHKNLRVQCVQW